MLKVLFLILIVGLLTFWQTSGFSILDIKPNLALVAIIAASFFIDNLWQGIFLVVFSALILKFVPGFEKEILIFSLIGVGAVLIKNRLPWRQFLANIFLVSLGTLIFYLFLAPRLIISVIFWEELVLNLIFGALIFALMSFLWHTKKI